METAVEDLIRSARLERLRRAGEANHRDQNIWQQASSNARAPYDSSYWPQLGRLFGSGPLPPAHPNDTGREAHAEPNNQHTPESCGFDYDQEAQVSHANETETPKPLQPNFDPIPEHGPRRPPTREQVDRPADTTWAHHLAQESVLPREPTAASLPLETSAFDMPDLASIYLAEMVDEDRRRRDRRRKRREQHRRGRRDNRGRKRQPPKRFLFCFPWVKSRRMRSQILLGFVSGLFLICMLAVYLGLLVNKNIATKNSDLTYFLVAIILIAAFMFCGSLIRLCLLMAHGNHRRGDSPRYQRPQMMATGKGYAVPREPIRVTLAQDEEVAFGSARDAPRNLPPAYGHWRESHRVDPDRLFWQRADADDLTPTPMGARGREGDENLPHEPRAGPRPPSYSSDDGVSYIVDAVPRSTAPTTAIGVDRHAPTHASASSVYSALQF